MINDVIVTPLRKIPDERGCIFHMLRCDSPNFERFGEIYFSTAYPSVVKGWHEHTKQTQNYAVLVGMIKLVLFDNRKNSETYSQINEIYMGDENYCLVTIPVGVVNGYKCISSERCILANCSTLPHEPGEMIRYDPLDSFIPYDWQIVMR
tara:strand:+ start:5042 stop:5491 length:450 start_codon:yes stop_codon:yes gene_type:complete